MKKVSASQAKKNAIIAQIKSDKLKLSDRCEICHQTKPLDAAHILCKGSYPEYYLEPRNIALLCRECHVKFDNNIDFRQLQIKLFNQAFEFAPLAAKKYFKFNK